MFFVFIVIFETYVMLFIKNNTHIIWFKEFPLQWNIQTVSGIHDLWMNHLEWLYYRIHWNDLTQIIPNWTVHLTS